MRSLASPFLATCGILYLFVESGAWSLFDKDAGRQTTNMSSWKENRVCSDPADRRGKGITELAHHSTGTGGRYMNLNTDQEKKRRGETMGAMFFMHQGSDRVGKQTHVPAANILGKNNPITLFDFCSNHVLLSKMTLAGC